MASAAVERCGGRFEAARSPGSFRELSGGLRPDAVTVHAIRIQPIVADDLLRGLGSGAAGTLLVVIDAFGADLLIRHLRLRLAWVLLRLRRSLDRCQREWRRKHDSHDQRQASHGLQSSIVK